MIKNLALCILSLLLIVFVNNGNGQAKPKKSKLIYYYSGDGCPACNYQHPEHQYGFEIECSGCIVTQEIKTNNLEVSRILDKKYGQGWAEKYIEKYGYCE